MNRTTKYLIVFWVGCSSILSVLCFSGCIGESESEEYIGILFDSIYEESNNNVYIFLDGGQKQISIYQDSTEYTVRQLQLLVQHNLGHKVRIVYTSNECKWFEILD